MNAVEVAFGDASDGVAILGRNSAEQFGLSTRAVNEAAVSMTNFAEQIDAANPADAFGNILQRATDFASVMNIDVEDALSKFQSALGGQSRPLQTFGIDTSAARIQQVALAEGIIDTNREMTQGEKVQARFAAIMQQTAKTAGDFANTSDELANRQRILSARWEEAQAVLGQKLAPVMVQLLEAGENLLPVFLLLADAVGDLVTDAAPLIDVLGEAAELIGGLGDEAGGVLGPLGRFGDVLGRINDLAGLASPLGLWRKGLELLPDATNEATASTQIFAGTLEIMANRERRAAEEADFMAGRMPIVTEALETFAKANQVAADRVADQIKSVRDLRIEHLRLTSPIFDAEQAIEDFTQALRDADADGKRTQDEMEGLLESFARMKEAEANVGLENIRAAKDLAIEMNEAIGGVAGELPGFLNDMAAIDTHSLTETEKTIQRWENIVATPITVKIEAKLPSRRELESAITDALGGVSRNSPGLFNLGL